MIVMFLAGNLFTPDNMLLTLEPGGIWTYTRSDVPMGEKNG